MHLIHIGWAPQYLKELTTSNEPLEQSLESLAQQHGTVYRLTFEP